MGKRIRHMGMTLTKEEHDEWHRTHGTPPILSPKQHDAMTKKMGIAKEQDEEWHRTHTTGVEPRAKGLKPVNPFAVGGGFLAWCVKQGWLVQQKREYFASKDGMRELRERFGIEL